MAIMSRAFVRVSLAALVLLAGAACARSPRRATVVPAPTPANTPGVQGEQPPPVEKPAGSEGEEKPEAELPQGAVTPTPTPSPSVSSEPETPDTDTTTINKPDPSPSPSASTTPTDDVTKWDGQSFKGNAQWDVAPAP